MDDDTDHRRLRRRISTHAAPAAVAPSTRNGSKHGDDESDSEDEPGEGVPTLLERISDRVVVVDRLGYRRGRYDLDRDSRQCHAVAEIALLGLEPFELGLTACQLTFEGDEFVEVLGAIHELADVGDALAGVTDAHVEIDQLLRHVLGALVDRLHGARVGEPCQQAVDRLWRHLHDQHGVSLVVAEPGPVAVVDVRRGDTTAQRRRLGHDRRDRALDVVAAEQDAHLDDHVAADDADVESAAGVAFARDYRRVGGREEVAVAGGGCRKIGRLFGARVFAGGLGVIACAGSQNKCAGEQYSRCRLQMSAVSCRLSHRAALHTKLGRSTNRFGSRATLDSRMRYDRDILDDFAESRKPTKYPTVDVSLGMVVEDRSSGFVGDVVRWNSEAVTLRDRKQYLRHFTWKPGGFLLEGKPVTLVRPAAQATATQQVTASGSIAADRSAGARVAKASRIWVEGKHDAELLEHVWGDDLRELGIVVEPLHGADDLAAAVGEFQPGGQRRLGVLLDHLVAGSKESRIAATVDHPAVLITGHPFVDVWAGIRPKVVGLQAWPDVPRGTAVERGHVSRRSVCRSKVSGRASATRSRPTPTSNPNWSAPSSA